MRKSPARIVCTIGALLLVLAVILYSPTWLWIHLFDISIHEAAALGNLAAIESAVERQPESINAMDERGYSPLHIAVMQPHREAVKLLVRFGADPNLPMKNQVGKNSLEYARWMCNIRCARQKRTRCEFYGLEDLITQVAEERAAALRGYLRAKRTALP